jgi:large subunit ribosomal protein L1
VEKAGIVHASIGKRSFDAESIRGNLLALIEMLIRLKPASAKGVYMKTVGMSSTMGPGIKLDPSELQALIKEL